MHDSFSGFLLYLCTFLPICLVPFLHTFLPSFLLLSVLLSHYCFRLIVLLSYSLHYLHTFCLVPCWFFLRFFLVLCYICADCLSSSFLVYLPTFWPDLYNLMHKMRTFFLVPWYLFASCFNHLLATFCTFYCQVTGKLLFRIFLLSSFLLVTHNFYVDFCYHSCLLLLVFSCLVPCFFAYVLSFEVPSYLCCLIPSLVSSYFSCILSCLVSWNF